jgi:UDP-N-acetylmuramyl pentapeptide synthase
MTGFAPDQLAICAALWLGVPAAIIQERLGTWKFARWRGELWRKDGRLIYVDCRNANPAAICPTLAGFSGAIFVKGSRQHHLEQALDPEGAPC